VAPPLVWIAVGAALTVTPACAFVGWVAAVLSGTPCGGWP
jgi:Na+/glutamate symporter